MALSAIPRIIDVATRGMITIFIRPRNNTPGRAIHSAICKLISFGRSDRPCGENI